MNEISLLIDNKELSTLKDKILSKSGYEKNEDLMIILGIINTLGGNFQTAINSFSSLEDKRYLEFIVNTINSEYIPLYNQVLKELKRGSSIVDELFFRLEKILPNTELYEMMTLYYLEKLDIEKAKLALYKGLEVDSSSLNLLKLKDYFKAPQSNNSIKKTASIAVSVIGIIVIGMSLNYNKKVEQERKEKLEYVSKLKDQEESLIKLEEQIINFEKLEVTKEKQIIEKTPLVIEPTFIDDFTQRELYRKAQTYRNKKSLGKAVEYYNLVINSEEESYLKRESLFWLGRSYEDLGNNLKAIESFERYIAKYRDEKIYLLEVESRLKKIGKKER